MKSFKTEVLLSITTGVLLCEFSDMHECVEFLDGGPVFTHQLAYKPFVDALSKSVLVQHPDLECDASEVGPHNFQAFRKQKIERLGPERSIVPMSALTQDTRADDFYKPLEGKKTMVIES